MPAPTRWLAVVVALALPPPTPSARSSAHHTFKTGFQSFGQVDACRRTVVCAERTNCTREIQAALDMDGVHSVLISNGGDPSPMIVEPLFIRSVSHRTITLEAGVELLAMAGSFTGLKDSLLTIINSSNITLVARGAALRMRKMDYLPPLYTKGEWRHTMQIRASHGVSVQGGTFLEAGGDGVYIDGGAGAWNPPNDILLDGLLVDSA
jgi:hypothetical protein